MMFVCAKSLQSCLTLCDPMDCSPPGPSVRGDFPGKNTGVDFQALLHGIGASLTLFFKSGENTTSHISILLILKQN